MGISPNIFRTKLSNPHRTGHCFRRKVPFSHTCLQFDPNIISRTQTFMRNFPKIRIQTLCKIDFPYFFFTACIKSRNKPVMDAELAHHLTTIAHLGNVAYRSGRKITWDPVKEQVVGDPQADQYVGVKYREPWKLPYRRRAELG